SDVSSSTANSGNTPYYWPAYKLGFYAANRPLTVTESSAAKLTPSIDNFTVSRSALNAPDELMVALEAQQRDGNGTPVQLGLHHALSRLTIQVQKTIPGYDISVAGVQIGGFKSVGTFTFPQYNTTNAASDAAWEGLVSANYGNANNLHTCWGSLSTPLQYGCLSLDNDDLSGTAMTSSAQNIMGGAYFYVIPQGVTLTTAASGSSPDITDHWIDLLINVKAHDSGAQVYPSSSNANEYAIARVYIPESQTFEAGKSYTVTLNFSTGLGVSMSNLSLYNGSSSDLSSSLDSENFVKNVSSDFPDNTFILGSAMDYNGDVDMDLNYTVTEMTFTGSDVTLWKGDNTTYSATVSYEEVSPDSDVTWTSSDPGVAIVDENGVVTAINPGSATITATSNVDTDVSASRTVYVNTLTGITLNKSAMTIYHGDTGTITATAQVNSGGATYGTVPTVTINWASDNTSYVTCAAATTNSAASLTTSGPAIGSANVSASISADTYGTHEALSSNCVVTVQRAVSSVSIGTAAATIWTGSQGTTTYTATTTYSDGTSSSLASLYTWTSSDTSVATVNANGVVTGVNYGTATITATNIENGTKVGSQTINVRKFKSLNIEYGEQKRNNITISVGEYYTPVTVKVRGSYYKPDGGVIDNWAPSAVTWTESSAGGVTNVIRFTNINGSSCTMELTGKLTSGIATASVTAGVTQTATVTLRLSRY
ncbi:MAG: Ig-like domain-containing protein, partial [Bacteroidales bacterium]|nr:Ig-like domain-containing protein [Bacteroidales bacterium]